MNPAPKAQQQLDDWLTVSPILLTAGVHLEVTDSGVRSRLLLDDRFLDDQGRVPDGVILMAADFTVGSVPAVLNPGRPITSITLSLDVAERPVAGTTIRGDSRLVTRLGADFLVEGLLTEEASGRLLGHTRSWCRLLAGTARDRDGGGPRVLARPGGRGVGLPRLTGEPPLMRCTQTAPFINGGGILHGGVLAHLLWEGGRRSIPGDSRLLSASVHFARALARGESAVGISADVRHAGRTTAAVTSRALDTQDRLGAIAQLSLARD